MFRHDGKVYEHVSIFHGELENVLILRVFEDSYGLWRTDNPELGVKSLKALDADSGCTDVRYVILEARCVRWVVCYDLMGADGDTTEHANGPYYTFAEACAARSGFEKLENFLGASVIPLELSPFGGVP